MGIIIKNTAIYHPENRVSNEELTEEFKSYGKDIAHFLEAIGRNERFLDRSGNETSVTMAIKAVTKLLEKEGLSGSDIDSIVFSSGTPEYLIPPNSAFVHHAIGGKNTCQFYDMNANCVGMVVAVEQTIRNMQSNAKIKYAIVVGSEQMNQYGKKDDELTRGIFGDGACAVLLQSNEEAGRGFIDSAFYSDSSVNDQMLFPACGLSNVYREETPSDSKMIVTVPSYKALRLAPEAKMMIENMLDENDYTKDDVQKYFISQISVKGGLLFSQLLQEESSKFPYVGDQYGYTGTSSPFFALHHALEDRLLHEGDLFVIWSVGAGQSSCGILIKR